MVKSYKLAALTGLLTLCSGLYAMENKLSCVCERDQKGIFGILKNNHSQASIILNKVFYDDYMGDLIVDLSQECFDIFAPKTTKKKQKEFTTHIKEETKKAIIRHACNCPKNNNQDSFKCFKTKEFPTMGKNNCNEKEKKIFKYAIRELLCTCFIAQKGLFSVFKSDHSKAGVILGKVFSDNCIEKLTSDFFVNFAQKTTRKDVKEFTCYMRQKAQIAIITYGCSCINENEDGSIKIEELPFKINMNNPRGKTVLKQAMENMSIDLDSTVSIVNWLKLDPNIIMPGSGKIEFQSDGVMNSSSEKRYYTSLLGRIIRLIYKDVVYKKVMEEDSQNQSVKIDENQKNIIFDLLSRGGKFDSIEFDQIYCKDNEIVKNPREFLTMILGSDVGREKSIRVCENRIYKKNIGETEINRRKRQGAILEKMGPKFIDMIGKLASEYKKDKK